MLSIAWKQNRKHQTNQSSSKATYPFSKDKRFKKENQLPCDSFYNIPSTIGKSQSSSIGLGSKLSLINSNNTPAPSSYHIKSSFDELNHGVKFSLGRQSIKANSIFKKSETPEPGHYNISTSLNTKRGFTIYSKLALPEFSNSKNPGPGHYKSIQSLNQSGRYILSKLSNCPGYKIKQYKPYDPNKSRMIPGPGQYDRQKENINSNGSYFASKYENSRCRTFSRSQKKGLVSIKKIPGPGAYNYYSQFGKGKV